MAKNNSADVSPEDILATSTNGADAGEDGVAAGGEDVWAEILNSLEGAKDFIFTKGAKTRVRLIGLGSDPKKWFAEVPSTFRGQTKSKYLLLGYMADKASQGDEGPKLKGIILPKTALKGILGLQQEGYDLFSRERGHGATITKSGSDQQTSYTVAPSPKPVPVPDEVWAEAKAKGLKHFQDLWTQREAKNRSNGNGTKPEGEEGEDW